MPVIANRRNGPKGKLLVVDDDEALRRLMHLELSETHDVIDTGEPEHGLALALEHMPDAILLDLRMPKYSGYELCQTFTSFSRTQAIYFEKPLDFEALRVFLRGITKSSRHIPRSEVRVRLRVPLKLRGKDAQNKDFEEPATTENVSLSGFLCTCNREIPVHSIVDVYMVSTHDEHVGRAQIMHSESKAPPLFRYGCRFTEKKGPWVLR